MARSIGIHLPLITSFADVAQQAQHLGAEVLQVYLMPTGSRTHREVTSQDRAAFDTLRAAGMQTIVGHCSFRINLASSDTREYEISCWVFARELAIAHALGITQIVLHPGIMRESALTEDTRHTALRRLVCTLQQHLDAYPTITVLLENMALGNGSLCSDFADFKRIHELTQSEQIRSCLDTAHAWAYGYDVRNTEDFLTTIDATIKIDRLQLLHLNDNTHPRGSKIDRHALPGDGMIGREALETLAHRLSTVPAVTEVDGQARI